MASIESLGAREAEFARFASSNQEMAGLREHLKEIIAGPAFKGSHRSGQFLRYIVEQALAGRVELLKERLIGVELFGRAPAYDTGEDAIVRVTASDVRRRLLQHYGASGTACSWRIGLPLGSYVPEIVRVDQEAPTEVQAHEAAHHDPQSSAPHPAESKSIESHEPAPRPVRWKLEWSWKTWLGLAVALALVSCAGWWLQAELRNAHGAATSSRQKLPQPWASLLTGERRAHVVTSDPNIVVVQQITGSELSLSDYANHKYIPEGKGISPDVVRYCRSILWGDNSAAAVDPPIAVQIATLAAAHSATVDARASRSVQLADLKTDDNLIFLGSPRSNPWTLLFSDQLDFRFVFDPVTKQEILADTHPRSNEAVKYVPTALGWATGESYAIVAFVKNPDTHGQVLILAGANGEGTQAAGEFVTDLPRLGNTLAACGVKPYGPPTHFEILLRMNTMAGSPSRVDVAACHLLGGAGQ